MERVEPHPWSVPSERILEQYGVDPQVGLSAERVTTLRSEYGPNRLGRVASRGIWTIFADQLKSVVVLLLFVAAALSFALGDVFEAVAICSVLLLNTALGFVTELKASRSMDALRVLGQVTVVVRRDGVVSSIPAQDLVPGDIVIIEAGDIIAADLRLLDVSILEVDESALTGESIPVSKSTTAVAAGTHVSERHCVLHKGTAVTRGAAHAVTFATGRATQMGHIAAMLDDTESESTPLEKQLRNLGQRLVWLVLGLMAVMIAVALLTERDIAATIKLSIAVAVAAIPEGLPIVATVALARGMWRMASRNAVVSRLSAVETLGATSILLTDKTGTLTENQMSVQQALLVSGEDALVVSDKAVQKPLHSDNYRDFLRVIALCNNASIDGQSPVGDPTEIALLEFARACGAEASELASALPLISQVAFDPDRQMMATRHRVDGQVFIAVKGGPEAVLSVCTRLAGERSPMDTASREAWSTRSQELAAQGLRVLAMAARTTDVEDDDPYCELTLLGLVGLWDPPRQDVAGAIADLRAAGIRPIMVTGDHPATAGHIARAVGIVDDRPHDVIDSRLYTSAQDLDPAQLRRLLDANVIARCSPAQKLELMRLHQKAGHIVAMTGDGVNDAPALKHADIGIAMGRRGTAVARQAAAIILRDDALTTIVEAVRYGRAIYTNIQRFVLYLVSCNLSEILVVGLALLFGAPVLLTPLQILFLNLVTDVFPALALGFTRADPNILRQPPRAADEPLMTRRHWTLVVLYGGLIALVVLTVAGIASFRPGTDPQTLTTATFVTLALAQIWHVFNMRDRRAGWRAATLRNPWVWGAVGLCLAILAIAMSVPVLQRALSLQSLPGVLWGIVLPLSFVPLLAGALVERAVNRLVPTSRR